MQIKSVSDQSFAQYGRIVENLSLAEFVRELEQKTPCPEDSVIYVPSEPALEALPIFQELRDGFYGGMPIQIGYCNGKNHMLNCLEYHRDSELNIAADDMILLVASLQKVHDGHLDTGEVEAFLVPKGTAVQLYETTLHYAPCSNENHGFRVAVILPRGTNSEKPKAAGSLAENPLLWACNKWLIAHPDSDEAKQGAFVGLSGDNIEIK